MIEISGKKYYLDIDAIIKWCLSPSNNTVKESEINEGYDSDEDGDIHLVSKVVRELKTNNTQDDTIRYDFIKLLLSPIYNGYFESNDSFSYKLLFNTLIKMKFLVKIID